MTYSHDLSCNLSLDYKDRFEKKCSCGWLFHACYIQNMNVGPAGHQGEHIFITIIVPKV